MTDTILLSTKPSKMGKIRSVFRNFRRRFSSSRKKVKNVEPVSSSQSKRKASLPRYSVEELVVARRRNPMEEEDTHEDVSGTDTLSDLEDCMEIEWSSHGDEHATVDEEDSYIEEEIIEDDDVSWDEITVDSTDLLPASWLEGVNIEEEIIIEEESIREEDEETIDE